MLPGGLGIPVLCQCSRKFKIKVKESVWCNFRCVILFISQRVCVWHTNCSRYFGVIISIFLSPKFISYPWILTIHCLYTSLFTGLPIIDCCTSTIGKILLGPQENLIFIWLLISLLFQCFFHRIQNISSQMSVDLNSSQIDGF